MKRRNFLSTAATAGFATALFPNCNFMSNPDKDLKISLAQWSLNKAIFGKTLDPMDFAKKTRDFDINGIEYVSSFYSHHSDLLEMVAWFPARQTQLLDALVLVLLLIPTPLE